MGIGPAPIIASRTSGRRLPKIIWRSPAETGRSARGLDVVLVVGPRERAMAPAPAPAILGVPLPLTGRGGTGSLAAPQAGMGNEQGLAERTSPPTTSPRGPGHEVTSAEESVILIRTSRRGSAVGRWDVSGIRPRLVSSRREEGTRTHSPSVLML